MRYVDSWRGGEKSELSFQYIISKYIQFEGRARGGMFYRYPIEELRTRSRSKLIEYIAHRRQAAIWCKGSGLSDHGMWSTNARQKGLREDAGSLGLF